MKVLHISTSDIDGGAARAAYRLHQGLQSIAVTSQMLVRAKSSSDSSVIAERQFVTKLGPSASGLPLKLYSKHQGGMFSAQWFPDAIKPKIAEIDPDIVSLHWVCNGLLQIETLAKLKKPIVWTLQDMWALTGGCHYNEGCDRYTQACGACPQLGSSREFDLSRWIWQRKQKAWQDLNLTLVAPSQWMADCAKASSLFQASRVEVIPFGLDIQKYKPIEQKAAREILGLPLNKKLVLFGAISATSDQRKGFHLLQPALQQLGNTTAWRDQLELVVFGSSRPEKPIDLGFNAHYLGHLGDDISLALLYSAANVMVVPSLQESFGQTASESLACGTPVVAFAATGLKDIVDHQKNGYLARPFEIDDLAQGIAWILEDSDRYQKLSIHARGKAEDAFTWELQAKRYLKLFNEILDSPDSKHI